MIGGTTRAKVHINAPKEKVFRAFIDPEAVKKWRFPEGMAITVHEFDGRQGGYFRISLTYTTGEGKGKTTADTDTYHGRFLRLVPNEQIVEVDEFEADDPALAGRMMITVTLTDHAGGTDVLAVHKGVPKGVSPDANETAWRTALKKLADYLETAE